MLKDRKWTGIALASIILLYLVTMGITVILPVVSAFAGQGDSASISLLTPILVSALVITVTAAGFLYGERRGYRTVALAASFLTLTGVCGSAVLAAFKYPQALLFFRLLTGMGLGLFVPFGFVLVRNAAELATASRVLAYLTVIPAIMGTMLQNAGSRMAVGGLRLMLLGLSLVLVSVVCALLLQETQMRAFAIRMIDWERGIRELAVLAGIAILMTASALARTWFGMQSSILTAGLLVGGYALSVLALAVAAWTIMVNFFAAVNRSGMAAETADWNNNNAEQTVNQAWTNVPGGKKRANTMNETRLAVARCGVITAGAASG